MMADAEDFLKRGDSFKCFVDTIFQQGGLETTGVNTDLAINGSFWG